VVCVPFAPLKIKGAIFLPATQHGFHQTNQKRSSEIGFKLQIRFQTTFCLLPFTCLLQMKTGFPATCPARQNQAQDRFATPCHSISIRCFAGSDGF